MDSQPDISTLLEAVLTGSTLDPLTQHIKSKQLHHFLVTSPNSVLRGIKILLIKMKNQNKITDQNFCAFDNYLKKIMVKDSNATLELKNSVGSGTIEKLKFFSLYKFEKISQKRLNFSFSKIKQYVYSKKVINEQKNAFKVMKVVKKIRDKLIRKHKLETFSSLKIKENKRFGYRKKNVLLRIVGKIIENCACMNEQMCTWKWKNRVWWLKINCENPGFLRKFENFVLVKKNNLYEVNFVCLLKKCFDRSRMRIFYGVQSDFNVWKNFTRNGFGFQKKISFCLERKDLDKSLQNAVRICSLYYFCRLKWIFTSFYISTLNDARIEELSITRKIKRRRKVPIFLNFKTQDHKPSWEYLLILLKPILKRAHLHLFHIKKQKFSVFREASYDSIPFIEPNLFKDDLNIQDIENYTKATNYKIKHEKLHKHLSSTQKSKKKYEEMLKTIVLFMKKIKLIKEKAKTQAVFKWIQVIENKKTQNLMKFVGVFLNFKGNNYEICRWVFTKIKDFNRESMKKTLKLLAQKAILFKYFKTLLLENWVYSTKIKLSNHKFAVRRLVNLEKKLVLPYFKYWKSVKPIHNFCSNIKGRFTLNQVTVKRMLKIFNKPKNAQEHSVLVQWKFQTILRKTRNLKKNLFILKLATRLFFNIQKQLSYSFSILLKNRISHNLKFFVIIKKVLKRFLGYFFNLLLLTPGVQSAAKLSIYKNPKPLIKSQKILMLHLNNLFKNSHFFSSDSSIRTFSPSKLSEKLKSIYKLLKILKKNQKYRVSHTITRWKSLSRSKSLLKKYATIIITTTSISYMTGFWRWVNTIRAKYKDLHPKYHPLLSRLTRIFKSNLSQTKFYSFYNILIYEPTLPDTETSLRFDQKKFFLSDFMDNDSTHDKSQSINFLLSPKAENSGIKFLGAGKVIITKLIKAMNRKLCFAFCGIQYSSSIKKIGKFENIFMKKREILKDLRKLVWENLNQKLRKKQIGRSIKLCKNDINSNIYHLKTSKLKQMVQLIMKPIIKSHTFAFIKLKLNN